jgi:hypothetical protein
MANTYVIALAVNASGTVFVGTSDGGGVFQSVDNGESWMSINAGLTTLEVVAGGKGSREWRNEADALIAVSYSHS